MELQSDQKNENSLVLCLIANATGVEDFYFREQIQTVIKPRFYPRLCQVLMKIIPGINPKTSVSNGGLGMCESNDFSLI